MNNDSRKPPLRKTVTWKAGSMDDIEEEHKAKR